MGNPENQPNMEELTNEAADMVEGNKALAEKVQNSQDFKAGYAKEKATGFTAQEGLSKVIADYRNEIEASTKRLQGMEPNSTVFLELQQKIEQMTGKLIEKEAMQETLTNQNSGIHERHNRLMSEQEIRAKHPEDLAAESVAVASDAAGDLDTEVGLRIRVPQELKQRKESRDSAALKEKTEALMKEDREIIADVARQFTELKANIEGQEQDILAQTQLPENQQKVAEAIAKIEKLRSAIFKKEEKRNEANSIVQQMKNWYIEKFASQIWQLKNEVFRFTDANSDRYNRRVTEATTLGQIHTNIRYGNGMEEAGKQIHEEISTLYNEIVAYQKNIIDVELDQMFNKTREMLHLDKLKEDEKK